MTTAYPTWQSFEEEVSYVWRNAREYNEDDSDISILAVRNKLFSFGNPPVEVILGL
jgi:hypothetical protein